MFPYLSIMMKWLFAPANMNNLFTLHMKFVLYFVTLFAVAEGGAQPIDVMTYNIRYDNPGDGINSWANRKEEVYDLLRKYDPDVIGVQEALHHQLTAITENLPGYRFIGVGRDDGKERGEYSAVLLKRDRFQILDQNTFWLSETPEVPGSKSWDAAITRVATWVKLKDLESGKEFLLLNTHFDHIGKTARKNSADLIKQKAEEIADGLPVIITGDFNFTREDEPYAVIMGEGGLHLNDPAPVADPPGTFCNFGVNAMPCRAIDYILHSDHWESTGYNVITDNDGKNYPSDHLPVMTTLRMK